MDLQYVIHSVQGWNILMVGVISISIVAIVIGGLFWNEKQLQAGNEDEH